MKKYRMTTAQEWDQRYAEKERLWSEEANPFLKEIAAELEPGRALDLGAGEGRNSLWLAAQGWEVTGVDFSSVAIERAAKAAAERGLEAEWEVADLREYSPPAAAFDLVLIAYIHPDPEGREALFRTAAEAVAPGGHLVVVGRDLADIDQLGQGGPGGPSDPERRYTPERLRHAFPGIELARCESVRREVDTDAGPKVAIDTLAFGRRPA